MLTDTRLRNLKPKEKLYKVNDRDGLYVAVTPAGTISFRYNYSINAKENKNLHVISRLFYSLCYFINTGLLS